MKAIFKGHDDIEVFAFPDLGEVRRSLIKSNSYSTTQLLVVMKGLRRLYRHNKKQT